jgi:glutathione S-transferase
MRRVGRVPADFARYRDRFGWIDQEMAGGRTFILGDRPGLPDTLAYHLGWFVRGRWVGGPDSWLSSRRWRRGRSGSRRSAATARRP